MPKPLLLSAVILSFLFASVVNAEKSPDTLSLLDQPIGEQRRSTLSLLEQQWGAQASCSVSRTGVGMTRRSYFLETCVFSNKPGHTLYDETPATATYQFLEDQLVQVSYHFEQVSDPAEFRRCAEQAAKKLQSRQTGTSERIVQGIVVTGEFQVHVSDVTMVQQIHTLRDTLH